MIITWGISLKNYKKIFVLLLSLILIFFVKKNSGIATVIMLLLLYKKEWLFFRISIFINFFISIISLYFKEIMDKLGIIIGVLKEGAFYTLQMRLLIWKEVFLKIIEKNLIFGTKGIITAFPENIIWYFLQPYGLFGIITVLYFIYTKKYKKQYILLLCVLIFQGISYYGLIVVPISYSFFALLGYYASEDILNKDAKKNIYNVMKEEKKK